MHHALVGEAFDALDEVDVEAERSGGLILLVADEYELQRRVFAKEAGVRALAGTRDALEVSKARAIGSVRAGAAPLVEIREGQCHVSGLEA